MDFFKEKMETWERKLVRLKQDITTGDHSYPKGLIMQIRSVSTGQVRIQSFPCKSCGVSCFMTIKGLKCSYPHYFEFVEESELNNRGCNNENTRF